MGPGRSQKTAAGKARSRTILFHPDYTVGPGVTPDLLTLWLWPKALAGYTAGGELHPALRMPDDMPGAVFVTGARVWTRPKACL